MSVGGASLWSVPRRPGPPVPVGAPGDFKNLIHLSLVLYFAGLASIGHPSKNFQAPLMKMSCFGRVFLVFNAFINFYSIE